MAKRQIRKSNHVPPAPRRSVSTARRWRKIRYFWLLFVASVTMLSALQLNDWLSPQVEFAKGETLDPENALSTRFVVTNRSPFALSNVQSYCDVHDVRLRSTYRFRGLRLMAARASFLGKGDQWSVICPLTVPEGNGAQLADVTLQITFDYLGSMLHRTRYQRFATRADKQGVNIWVPIPSPKDYRATGPIICETDVADGCTGVPEGTEPS